MQSEYTLYGTSFSYYSGKLRCYLQKKGIPFQEVLATTKVYKKLIIPRTGVRYIPVLQTPEDEVWQDTTEIIDHLEQRFSEHSVYPTSPKQKLAALLLETYGDEWLVIPAMHYRWSFPDDNQPLIYSLFGSLIAPRMPVFVRAWLGRKLSARFAGALPLLGITDDTKPAIEASYTQLLADLDQHFQQHDYVLGSRPCIADFGLIGPFYAHLYHDPYPGRIMRATAPAVAAWVERMTDGQPASGDLLPNDDVPSTLMPVLQRLAREQLPVLIDTDRRLGEWREDNPDAAISRSIGKHEFELEGVTAHRVIFPYALWMYRRSVDFYQSLSDHQKAELQTWLNHAGVAEALNRGLNNHLVRCNNQLEFAE